MATGAAALHFHTETVTSQRAALKRIADLIRKGSIDPDVRRVAHVLIRDCEARDDLCELEAIFHAVKHGDPRVPALKNGVRYVADPRAADFYTGARAMLENCQRGACGGDCLPLDALVLSQGYRLTPVGELRVGDLVMGDGDWVRVTSKWDKEIQPLLAFRLNNGGVLRCTPDHRLFRVPIRRGVLGVRADAEEVRAGRVRVGDALLTAESIPYGRESFPPEQAWLLGAYIADGWASPEPNGNSANARVYRAFLSGLDGKRKEAQKARAKTYCDSIGVATRWHRKYLAMNDAKLAGWLAAAGHGALEKHIPSLGLDALTVERLLEGLSADCDVRDGVFGTISRTLALQYRLLLRMQGRSASIVRVDDHGGFGSHPIYRVTPRIAVQPSTGKRSRPFARVKAIEEIPAEPTVDIEVEGSRFYLPETDLIVHNCDEHVILVASLAASIGFKVGARAWGSDPRREEYSHVYAVAAVPKRGPWPRDYAGHGLDTTVPQSHVGWEPPRRRVLTFWLTGGE